MNQPQVQILQIDTVRELQHYLDSMIAFDVSEEYVEQNYQDQIRFVQQQFGVTEPEEVSMVLNKEFPSYRYLDDGLMNELGNDLITTFKRPYLNIDEQISILSAHVWARYETSEVDNRYLNAAIEPLCRKVYYTLLPLVSTPNCEVDFHSWFGGYLRVRVETV